MNSTFLDSVRGATHYSRGTGDSYRQAAPVTTGVGETPGFDAKWGAVIDVLLGARNLADDWDGQGAAAPPRVAVDLALKLALSLKSRGAPAPTDYGASVDGGVTLTWHVGKEHVVIEVTSALEVEGYRWTDGDAKAVRFPV